MGRESRQSRRARERRAAQKGKTIRGGRIGGGPNWSVIGAVAVLVAALAVAGALIAFGSGKGPFAGPSPTPTEAPGKTIAGLQCDPTEQVTYHVHGHLSIFNKGKPASVPAGIGMNYKHDCLYWVHTHNADGIIHVEAPRKVEPTLAAVFQVWHQPLNAGHIGPVAVQPGETVRTYVNGKLFPGNPADVKVLRHTTVTIEVGPPFVAPKPYDFGQL